MVMNLPKAGFEVSVFNRTKEKEFTWLREQNQQAVYKN
jgi:3-hydroxyisobutyrate dehydrogenase-like beta-hydroxyacid dehydrogenase